jgi:hypothetical protein
MFDVAMEILWDDSTRENRGMKRADLYDFGDPFASFSLTEVYISFYAGFLLLLSSALRKPQYRYGFLGGFRTGFPPTRQTH